MAQRALAAGYATEDGVGLHYIGTGLHEAVSIREHARAWWVEPAGGGGFRDEAIMVIAPAASAVAQAPRHHGKR